MTAGPLPTGEFEPLAFARSILTTESDALRIVAGRLNPAFFQLIQILGSTRGRIAVIGVGKSADVGRKIVGTFNSTGTRAYSLDATRAVHGDLGAVHPDDVALLLSHSGESEELLRLLGPLRGLCDRTVALTGQANSTLAKSVDAAFAYGPVREACPLALAPSTSTTVMIALGDALAFTLMELRAFTAEDFAKFHPAGSLGRKLAGVEQFMRSGAELRIASETETVRAVFARSKQKGRRTGAVMLTGTTGELVGLFTDSDLARLFESQIDGAFDRAISEVMTRKPLTVSKSAKMYEAMELLREKKFSELPVVDGEGKPVGMLDITDLLGLDPVEEVATAPTVLRLHAGSETP